MSRVGVWLVGGRGSVATTAMTGAAAVAAGLAEPTGLVTMRAPFTDAGLPELGDLVFGGHDVVETPLALRAARLVDDGVLPVGPARPRSAARSRPPSPSSARASPAARRGWSRARRSTASSTTSTPSARATTSRRVVVINVSSTEAPVEPHPAHEDPSRADGRAGPRPGRAPAQRAVRARGDRDRLRVRRLHALGRRAAARDRGAGRGARGAARRQRRQDRRDVHEVGARARRSRART